jgi:catechol 2,3-dioxygenase-like lactoylglutathione lyase family enzyme
MKPFAILGLDHVVLRARDSESLVRFYVDVLGCTVVKTVERLGLVHLRAGRSMIDVISVDGELGRAGGAPAGVEARNVDHVALRIEPFDEESLRAQLAAFLIDGGKVHDNFGAEGDGPSMYVRDPEGNTVELKGPAAKGLSSVP